jgi:hypothetical protein
MRLSTLCLIGALTVTAIPLSAYAMPQQSYRQQAASALQDTPAGGTCAPGWYWEPAGYVTHGKFRPAHCAPRY